ncbi:MAG: beta-lactamase family protein [Saprospiraceae bacterium]|nr:beta-lactamase family protein [Saprospiraceae bacterium]
MMFRLIFLIAILKLAVLPVTLTGQNYNALKTEVDKLVYLDAAVDFERSPAFIIGVIWGDSIFYLPYGSTDPDTSLLPTSQQQFEIGELSHLFATELFMLQLENDQLQPESTLGEVLDSTESTVQLQQLLRHKSGFPRYFEGFGERETDPNDPFAHVSSDDLLNLLPNYLSSQEETYQFSNLNFGLLALALERVSQSSYAQLLNNYIIEPLNLKHTGFNQVDSLMVTGFDKAKRPAAPWEWSGLSPAVGLKSSVEDLCTFFQYLMKQDRFSILAEQATETGIRKNTRISWGWHVLQQKRYYPIFLQTGVTSGYRAYVALVPQTQTAVVVLSNSTYGLGGIGFMTLRMLNNYWKR